MGAVTIHSDLEPKKMKYVTASTISSAVCHEVIELDDILVFLILSFFLNFILFLNFT